MSVAKGRMVYFLYLYSLIQLNVTKYQVLVATYEYDVWDLSIVLPDDENICTNDSHYRNKCHGSERVDHCSALI